MKALTVRGVDESTYDGLKAMAKRNRRSLQEQIRLILDREVQLSDVGYWETAESWRSRLSGRKFGDVVSEIRKDRER